MRCLIRIYTVCHSFLDLQLSPFFATVDVSKCRNRSVYFRNLGEKVFYIYTRDIIPEVLYTVVGHLFASLN